MGNKTDFIKVLYKIICYCNLDLLIHLRYLDSLSNGNDILKPVLSEIVCYSPRIRKHSYNFKLNLFHYYKTNS